MFLSDTNRNEPHKYQQRGFKKVQDVYEDIYDEKQGRNVTQKTDVDLFYDEIQETKDSVYLPSILEKYKIDINKKALVEVDTNVIDMTEMPTDMNSMYALMRNQEMKFQKLPAELKKQFDNNYFNFIEQMKTGETQQKIDSYNKEIRTKKGLVEPQKEIKEEKEITDNGQFTSI